MTVPRACRLLRFFYTASLAAALTACGGGGNDNSSAGAEVASYSSSSKLSSSSSSSSLSTSSSSSSIPKLTLLGGAMQGRSLVLKGEVSTLAGDSYSDGVGETARFNEMRGITSDGSNLYVVDCNNNNIRKIVIATGAVSTLAGGHFGSRDGIGAAAQFGCLTAITNDGSHLYVADLLNYTIRKVAIATGEVTTLAGGKSGNADGIGKAASFGWLAKMIVYGGNLYVVDGGNYSIRKIVLTTGEVTTLAGGKFGNADGIGNAASFGYIQGMAIDEKYLYLSEETAIRKIAIATGEVTTLPLPSLWPYYISEPISPGDMAMINGYLVVKDRASTCYIDSNSGTFSDCSQQIYRLDASTGSLLLNTEVSLSAHQYLGDMVVADDIYCLELYSRTIKKIAMPSGILSDLAGQPAGMDGIGKKASFARPAASTTDGINLYTLDGDTRNIRKTVLATGEVNSIAIQRIPELGADGSYSYLGEISEIQGIATDSTFLYVTEKWRNRILKIAIATGELSVLAGKADEPGSLDAVGESARFYHPHGITSDGSNLYVSDPGNHNIRKIVIATGEVSTVAGPTPSTFSSGYLCDAPIDDASAQVRFGCLTAITTDGSYLYLADNAAGASIRKVAIATGQITTLAGSLARNSESSLDGAGATATFNYIEAITTDGINIYATDTNWLPDKNSIRKVVIATAEVSTVIGGSTGHADGLGAAASFGRLVSITTDGKSLFVTDSSSKSIRKID